MERGPKTARGKPPLCKGRVLDTWIPYMTAFESSVIKTDCRHLLQRKDMCMENTKQTGCPYHSNGMGGCAAERPSLKKVFICSPFSPQGETKDEMAEDMNRNIHLAQIACRYAAINGFIPYAPHLYFTQFLDDGKKNEREYGQAMGFTWLAFCDELWVIGRRNSSGMEKEIRQAMEWGMPIKYFVPKRTAEERILDAVFFPDKEFHEMTFEKTRKERTENDSC